jgi:hypothetical protein
MRLAQDTQKSLNIKQDEEEQNFTDIIDAALLMYINQKVPERAGFIDQTNSADINDAIDEAQAELSSEGLPLDRVAVGSLAAILLKRKFEARKKTISMTETQFMAESTKAIEATVIANEGDINLNDVVGSIAVGAAVVNKRWASILDGNTRTGQFDHVVADGQKVPLPQAFIVSGERLMFPGDSSLGASIGNTINCRCSALYSL